MCVKVGANISPIGHTQTSEETPQKDRVMPGFRLRHRKLGVMPGFRLSGANSLPVLLTLEKGLEMLYNCLWNEDGTSKSGFPFHLPARNMSAHLYNPLKHMSQGEVGYGHIVRGGLKGELRIRNKEERHWINANFLSQRRVRNNTYSLSLVILYCILESC